MSHRAVSLAAAAILVLLSAAAIGMLNTIGQQRQELAEDRAALGLLTSTETANERLVREASWLPADAHGHWFHRDGVQAQVVVGELLPEPPAGQHYVVWLLHPTGWAPVGTMQVDASGYGRLVILGSDGADARAVLITRETQTAATPGPDVVLRYQGAF